MAAGARFGMSCPAWGLFSAEGQQGQVSRSLAGPPAHAHKGVGWRSPSPHINLAQRSEPTGRQASPCRRLHACEQGFYRSSCCTSPSPASLLYITWKFAIYSVRLLIRPGRALFCGRPAPCCLQRVAHTGSSTAGADRPDWNAIAFSFITGRAEKGRERTSMRAPVHTL